MERKGGYLFGGSKRVASLCVTKVVVDVFFPKCHSVARGGRANLTPRSKWRGEIQQIRLAQKKPNTTTSEGTAYIFFELDTSTIEIPSEIYLVFFAPLFVWESKA